LCPDVLSASMKIGLMGLLKRILKLKALKKLLKKLRD
jgi:hypothetical protein